MSRQTNQIDLRTEGGARQVELGAGEMVQYIFNDQQARIGAASRRAKYNCVRGINLHFEVAATLGGGYASTVHPDQFPRVISGISLTGPMYGTMLDPTVVNGMVAKHIMEFFGNGYQKSGINRAPMVTGQANASFDLNIPFSQFWNDDPDQFAIWLGWLSQSILEIQVSSSATPWGVAAATIDSVTVEASLDMVPWPELIVPPFVALKRYQQAASASSSGPILMNVGSSGALQGVDDGSRLLAMLFSHQAGGFVGSGTADQITAITAPWRDQAQTLIPGAMFQRFLRDTGVSAWLPTIAGAATPDLYQPYVMGTAITGRLNAATARYTPLVFPDKGCQISYLQKVKGNYPLDGMTFSTPQTDQFYVYTLELKQFSQEKCAEMIAAAGFNPSEMAMVPKLSKKNVKKVAASKIWGFPRSVVGLK